MTAEIRMRVAGFAPASPGWRLWVVGPDGKPEEVALAGWVTLAEVEYDVDPGGEEVRPRKTGYRSIHPGWICDGQVVTVEDEFITAARDTWAVGPADPVPTSEELAQWADRHRTHHERLGQGRKAR
jgi:hypothetical protein